MQFLLDQLVGIVVGGILILAIVGFNFQMNSASYDKFAQSTIQQSSISTLEVIEYDFYRIGYRIAADKISFADSTTIEFKTDLITNVYPEGDGNEDVIKYYLGEKSDLNSTPNPEDVPLYRKVNTLQPEMIGTVTTFTIVYHDNLGNELAYSTLTDSVGRESIKRIGLQFTFESPQKFDGRYQRFEIEKLISPKNLTLTRI